jgi:hypothetical protein
LNFPPGFLSTMSRAFFMSETARRKAFTIAGEKAGTIF